MAARKEIVRNIVMEGMPLTKALALAEVPKSSYYYKATGERKGKAPSTHTLQNGVWVGDDMVVQAIENLLVQDFIDYGYIRTTEALKQLGYRINKKKVYRLMKEHKLLFKPSQRSSGKRDYVEFTIPLCSRPFEVIELDIKYIYIQGLRRHSYLITLFDVFSRAALVWDLSLSMKSKDAVNLINQLIIDWLIPLNLDPRELNIKIRTDNGSQFIAKKFRDHLELVQIANEYIRPATPQQNGHIESFHNTLTKLVCNKYYFENIEEAKTTIKRFMEVYNNKRIMKSILYLPPLKFIQQWSEGKIICEVRNRRNQYLFRKKPSNQMSGDSSSESSFVQTEFNKFLNNFNNPVPI